jgi:hypothetical protein
MQAAAANKPIKRARRVGNIELPRVADGRSQYAKRFRKLVEDFVAQLGGDPSAEDAALIRQTVHLILTGEQMQAAAINGEDVDVDAVVRINSETRRNLAMLKAKADRSKPPAPTIHDLVAELQADEESEAS